MPRAMQSVRGRAGEDLLVFPDPQALCTPTPDAQCRAAEPLAGSPRVFSTRVHAFCSHVRLSREP